MKLKTTKLLYQRRNNLQSLILLLLILLVLPVSGYAQQLKFQFDNTPVSEALLEVARKTNSKIAFDVGGLKEYSISELIKADSVSVILSAILVETGYVAQFKHNTWLIHKNSTGKSQKVRKKQVAGIIFDHETGERLPYASIYIWNNNRIVSATVDGTFSVLLKETDHCYFQIHYLGYHTIDSIIDLTSLNNTLKFGLDQKLQNIATVNIQGQNLEMLELTNDAGHISFNPKRFDDLPNYGETDVFKSLQLLPGISSHESSSQLNIRGSSADQNLVTFDGFTLYNLDHFFGVFSALNPNVIKDIQVYRGGFDSRYGERVSGIVDITGKNGNRTKPQFYGGVNLISANLTTEIPISDKLTLVAAGRRAYTDVYSSWLADAILANKTGRSSRSPDADNIIEPEFYFGDFNAKLTWMPNDKENISLSAYGAKDRLNSSNVNERNNYLIDSEDVNKWGNYGIGISWKKQHKNNYFTNLQLGHSGYYNNYYNTTTIADSPNQDIPFHDLLDKDLTDEKNKLFDYFVTFKNTVFLNSSNQLDFGLSTRYINFEYKKDAEDDIVFTDLENSAFLNTTFLQNAISFGKRISVKPGLRLNYYTETKKFYFEPRLSANFKVNDNLLFKMATGKYYQFLNKSGTEQNYGYDRDFWVLSDGEVHPVVSANHFIVGTSFKVNKVFFDVEAYYKDIEGVQEFLFDKNRSETNESFSMENDFSQNLLSTFISGSGKAYGIDFLAKYQNDGFSSWLAYSLSKSTLNFEEINEGEEIPAMFDQTHEVKWTNMYSLNDWNFSGVMLYSTGTPYVLSSEKDDDFNVTREYNRLPDYFRIDLSLNYNFNIKKVNIKPGVSLLNALNTENYLDAYVREFNVEGEQFRQTTLVKAQDITLNVFLNFKF